MIKIINLCLVVLMLLSACRSETVPVPVPGAEDVIAVPTATMEPVPHPEPPIMVIALPMDYQQLLASCGPVEIASTSLTSAYVPQECSDLFSHGLRAKRLLDFAARGISVHALFKALSDGSAVLEKAGLSEHNGVTLGVLVSYAGHKVILIFGGVSKPTIYPLPWIVKGETMAQAMEKLWGPAGQFRTPVQITSEVTTSIKNLAGCVKRLLDKHVPDDSDEVTEGVPLAIPVPDLAAVMVALPPGAVANSSLAFASVNFDLLELDQGDVEILIILGVVVVVGYVTISCLTTGCITAPAVVPLLALVP